ncbi:MAG TPA: hypothetical protein VFQ91_26460 [Bryobacteraceae bacterium]|nr:hypothetical protein [Bryobacteraceae bacterium]
MDAVPPLTVDSPYSNTAQTYDPGLRLPRLWQWNFTIEQSLGEKQTITASYVGSAGRNLTVTKLLYPDRVGNAAFSQGRGIWYTRNGAASDYNALQLQLQRRLHRGLQTLASYTWSHSLDDASSNFRTLMQLRGSSDFDIRHNFQAALTYDIPGSYRNAVLSGLLKHWALDARISARSALPLDVIGATGIDPITGANLNFHPNLVPGQPFYLADPNIGRAFVAVQTDITLRREFPLHEQVRLQFRAEAFNALNQPIFGQIYSEMSNGAALFGTTRNTLNSQLGGLNSLYQVGGPRSLQLALRLMF